MEEKQFFTRLINSYIDLLNDDSIILEDLQYKYALIKNCENASNEKIIDEIRNARINNKPKNVEELGAKGAFIKAFEKLSSTEHKLKLIHVLDNLYMNGKSFDELFSVFNKTMKNLAVKIEIDENKSDSDERMASLFLACKYPQKYMFYWSKYYDILCPKVSEEPKSKAGQKYPHYLDILKRFCEDVKANKTLLQSAELKCPGVTNYPLLIAQNIIFEFLKNGKIIGDNTMAMEKEMTENQNTTENLDYYKKLLEENRNIILHGAPGTGKTYLAKEIANKLGADDDCIGFCQFHPSYDYTDFVEGLRPNKENGFERVDGVFKEFCKRALKNSEKPFIFIIDEINRGELSKIFGELFFSIDPGYRGINGKVKTQYANMLEEPNDFDDVLDSAGDDYGWFFVPENVYIIGTMNDIDRSVESMDFAMRRRFVFKEVTAQKSAENMEITGTALAKMNAINAVIEDTMELGKAYCIGGAYFLKNGEPLSDNSDFTELWELKIGPLVYEYLRGIDDDGTKYAEIKSAYDCARN